jgi:hypothetical protein
MLEGLLGEAQASGASSLQIESLESALAGNGLTYEVMAELNAAVIDCLNEGGVEAFLVAPIEIAPGLLMPQFGARPQEGSSDDQVTNIIGTCFFKNIAYAQQYYENQQSSVELQVRAFEDARPEILECLQAHGIRLDEDSSNDEIAQAVNRDIDENGQEPGFEPCYRGVLPESM